jgi:hypothetical protein
VGYRRAGRSMKLKECKYAEPGTILIGCGPVDGMFLAVNEALRVGTHIFTR